MIPDVTYKVVRVKIDKVRLAAAMKRASIAPLMKCGLLLEREAKVSMKKGGRRAGFKTGVPSAPGTPPHVQEGTLRASIEHAADMSKGTVVVGPTEWYGKIHEFGGRKHPKRPFMIPAFMACKAKFVFLFRNLRLRHY